MNNKEFLKKIKNSKSVFYLFDFHVHSPVSYDVVLWDRFQALSKEEKKLLDKDKIFNEIGGNSATFPQKYEEAVIDKFPPEDYYKLLVEHRNELAKEEGIYESENWSFVAITDHNVCRYAEKLSRISFRPENIKKNHIFILPGIELEISFKEPKTNEKINIHTLLIFKGNTTDMEISNAINKASNNKWDYSRTLNVENISDFIKNIRQDEKNPAICIAAHINSNKGIRLEFRKLFTQEDCKNKKEEMNSEDKIYSEILKLIGNCGFDALQISDNCENQYYKNINRYDKKLGREVGITCSDAHKIEDIFKCKSKDKIIMPFIKLNNISSSINETDLFEEIRDRALRYGETRVTFMKPGEVCCWIEGIQISKDSDDSSEFWINENSEDNENFTMSFSRNLNCIIGGRGTGKSASLEIIDFLNNNDEFIKQGSKNKNRSDWYERAKATLDGCKIKLCWRILNNEKLKRSSIFMEGFFNDNNRNIELTYTDIDENNILTGTISLPKADIYRIHDIEDMTAPNKLRALFDNICGEKIFLLTKEINEFKEKLVQNRKELIDLAQKIDCLTSENSPLREYARRKMAFDLVNKENIKKQFNLMDMTTCDKNLNDYILKKWENLIDKFKLEDRKNEINQIRQEIEEKFLKIKNENKVTEEYCEIIEKFIKSIDEKSISSKIEILKKDLNDKKDYIISSDSKIKNKINKLTEELRRNGIEKGGKDRQVKKNLYDESKTDLEKYQKYTIRFKKNMKKEKK